MENQALFSSKEKSKKIKMSSAASFVLRFNGYLFIYLFTYLFTY